VQRCVGYTLSGSVQEQVAFVCVGTSRNGKSTLLQAMYKLMGESISNARGRASRFEVAEAQCVNAPGYP
jgi:putative DNA primase/helicase